MSPIESQRYTGGTGPAVAASAAFAPAVACGARSRRAFLALVATLFAAIGPASAADTPAAPEDDPRFNEHASSEILLPGSL